MKKEIKLRSTLDLYKQMKVIGTSASCPRRGYYKIKEVADELEPSIGCKIKVAKAIWKLEKDEPFNEAISVSIQLETFSRNPFFGSKEQLENVLGKVILVRSLYIDKSNFDQPRLVCKWGVMDAEDSTVAPEELKFEEEIQNHLNEIEESNLELENAVLDQIEYIEEWDNYESIIYTNAVSMMDEPQLFPIPTNMIINKGKTGWGATHCEIKAKRNSIILLPHISQIDSKFNQYQHSDNVVKVTESVKPIDLINHIKKSGNQIIKFLCTPEGLPKLISAIRYCGINPYTDYFLLVDEFHKLTKDISYRVNISIAMRDFFDFENKAMISATPFRPSDPRFQDFKFIKVVHENDYKKPIHLVYTNNLTTAFKDYLAKYDGEMLFVFFSTLSGIHSLITSNQLEGVCNVYCSKDGTEDFKLKDFNEAYDTIKIEKLSRINFLTSSFFNGLDISGFKEMPDVLILTDIKYAEHTMIDPNTDTFQILGRFRPEDFKEDSRDRYRTATHIINTRHITHVKLEEQAIKDFKLSEYRYSQILELQATLTDEFLIHDVCGEALKRVNPYSNLVNSEGDLDYFKYDNYLYEHRLKMCYGHDLAPGLTYFQSNLFDITEERQLFLDEEFESMTKQMKRYSKENIKLACEKIDELKQYDTPNALELLNHWYKRFPLVERALDLLGYDAIEDMGFTSTKINKALLALDIAEKRIHQGTIDIVYRHFAPYTSYPVALVKEKLKKIFTEYGILGNVKSTDITLYFIVKEYTGHQKLTKKDLKLLKPDQPDADVFEVECIKAKSVRMYHLLERKHNSINLNTTRSAQYIVK